MKQNGLKELSNNSQTWRDECNQAIGRMECLIVHPSHIVALLNASRSKEFEKRELKDIRDSLEKIQSFIESAERGY